jgi:hypothetical protein
MKDARVPADIFMFLLIHAFVYAYAVHSGVFVSSLPWIDRYIAR